MLNVGPIVRVEVTVADGRSVVAVICDMVAAAFILTVVAVMDEPVRVEYVVAREVALVGLMVEAVIKEVKEIVEPVRVEYVRVFTFIEVVMVLRMLNIVAISICSGC